MRLAQARQPDIVLLDLAMPRLNGLEALRWIKAERPATTVMIVTMHTEDAYRQAAAKCTTRGEGGALALLHEEHVLTRTYGVRGRAVARAEAGLPFRQVLARDMRDVRRIAGAKYNRGLRTLMAYYREHFPNLIHKLPKPRSA